MKIFIRPLPFYTPAYLTILRSVYCEKCTVLCKGMFNMWVFFDPEPHSAPARPYCCDWRWDRGKGQRHSYWPGVPGPALCLGFPDVQKPISPEHSISDLILYKMNFLSSQVKILFPLLLSVFLVLHLSHPSLPSLSALCSSSFSDLIRYLRSFLITFTAP